MARPCAELLSTQLCLLRHKAQEIGNNLKSVAFLNVLDLFGLSFAYKLSAHRSGLVGGQAAQGEPALPLTKVRAAHCCLELCALSAPLSLSPEGLFLRLSLAPSDTISPETFLCHSLIFVIWM